MRKQLSLIFAVLLLTTSFGLAQEEEAGENRIAGLRAGWQNAAFYMDGSEYPGSEAYNTFYVGFWRDNQLAPLFFWGTGAEYHQTGLQMAGMQERVLHYVSLPHYLKIKLGPVFALGGVAPKFKVAERVLVGDELVAPIEANRSEWFDVPAFAGVGVKFLFITVEARYHWGLLDVYDGYNANYFQLGAGLSF